MTWTRYPLTRLHRTKRGRCVDCKRRTSRAKTFEASSNPFNDFPSEATLIRILTPVAESWLKAPLRCAGCEEKHEKRERERANDAECRRARA